MPPTAATPFVLDAYQREAIEHLDASRSVIVCAPTGAGKTVVAEHAIRRALARGRSAVYTTPLKALSNQKRADLARLFGVTVGLMTGDRVEQPDAPVVVMTTEVLRALLLAESELVERIDVVVLDEFHWIQDPQRGGVWEQVVVAAPARVALVCLSATLPGAPIVQEWMQSVHGSVGLVEVSTRPVELTHLYALGSARRDPPSLVPLFVDDEPNAVAELLDGVRNRRADDSPLRRRERDPNRPVPPERIDLIEELRRDRKLPAIWFLLSRAGCDAAVATCVDHGVRLTDVDEAHAVRELAYEATASMADADRRAIGFDAWVEALVRGVATHHGALAPVQREVIEVAFARELVKVVFATETLAVGVNLPARSVVIDRVVRPPSQGGGTLSVAEFAQLSGRAGRRGIDDVGFVVVPWSPAVSFPQLTALIRGRLPTLASHFAPTPAMVMSFARRSRSADLRGFVQASLRARLLARHADTLRSDLARARTRVDEHDDQSDAPQPCPAEVTLDHVKPGDVIVDPGRAATGTLAVIAPVRLRRGRQAVEVVGEDARRRTLVAGDLRAVPVVVGRIVVPEAGVSPRGFTRQVVDLLRVAPRAVALPAAFGAPRGSSVAARRARDRDAIAELQARVRAADIELDDELDAHVALLRRRGHLEGWTPTSSGLALSRLFHDAGLLVAEALRASLFDGLAPAELAAFASCFTPRGALADHAVRAPTPAVAAAVRAADQLARDLNAAEEELGLRYSPSPNASLSGVVFRWTQTGDLSSALRGSDVSAGDLVREARQVGELVEQIALVSAPALTAVCAVALAGLNRGVVVDELPDTLRTTGVR